MSNEFSSNAQAILLLTAPLLAGGRGTDAAQLAPGEYRRLARRLFDLGAEPRDLLAPDPGALIDQLADVVEQERLRGLLQRGLLLAQAVERWRTRSIWVRSRADADYPGRLRQRLRDESPPILYGCGDPALLDGGGLGVVGSRHVDERMLEYARAAGALAAEAGRALISGGAKGVDQAAMRGAVERGGVAIGILADSLERAALAAENRRLLQEGQLVLVSVVDPGAGFHVGSAMQRNKLIYLMADAVLVVNSDLNKGGTWTGAVEHLSKFRKVPVYARAIGEPGAGLQQLMKRGALPWPEPESAAELRLLLDNPPVPIEAPRQGEIALHDSDDASGPESTTSEWVEAASSLDIGDGSELVRDQAAFKLAEKPLRDQLLEILQQPKSEAELVEETGAGRTQIQEAIKELISAGQVQKLKHPVRYCLSRAGTLGF